MTDHIPDPAGWNRIAELEEQLRRERSGRDMERRALIRAMDRISSALALCAELRPWDKHDADSPEARAARAYNRALEQVREILDGGAP